MSARTEQFSLRPLAARDLRGVVALTRMVPEAPWWSEEHVRQIVAPLPDAPGEHPVLARRGWVASLAHDTAGEAVHGFLVLHSLHVGGTGEGEVESMVVDPAFRRRGLGRALMQSAADWCREHQVTVLRLEVRSRNSAAIALYRSASFVQTGIRHDYYASPPDDALFDGSAILLKSHALTDRDADAG